MGALGSPLAASCITPSAAVNRLTRGTAEAELVHQQRYPAREAAERDLFASIEGDGNRQRFHPALGCITPEQAQQQAA